MANKKLVKVADDIKYWLESDHGLEATVVVHDNHIVMTVTMDDEFMVIGTCDDLEIRDAGDVVVAGTTAHELILANDVAIEANGRDIAAWIFGRI